MAHTLFRRAEIIEYISNLPSSVQELIYNSLLETNNLKIEEISENFEENLINNLTYDELERILLNEKEIMPLNIIFSSTPKMTIKSVSVENNYKADVVEYTNPGEYPTVRFPGDYLKRNSISQGNFF